tara:strand:- start:460 stop:1068 length:609 start_codon:yes stop_codon:yes gene_type:complete
MKNKYYIIIVLIVSFLGTSSYLIINAAKSATRTKPPIISTLSHVEFESSDGSIFTNEDFKGRVTVLDFMFTSCQGPCPIMAVNMASLYRKYKVIPKVQFLSITVDPDFDTNEVLNNYALMNGVNDQRWKFLRSDMDKLKAISEEKFKFYAKDLPAGHSVKFILIDSEGNIRQYYDGTDKASMMILQSHINLFLEDLQLINEA